VNGGDQRDGQGGVNVFRVLHFLHRFFSRINGACQQHAVAGDFDHHCEVGGTSGDEDVVGVPVDAEDGGADGALDVLADPPVVVLLKVAHGYALRPTRHCELVPPRAPLDLGGCSVDSQDGEGGLPLLALLGPHVRIAVLGAGHDSVGVRSPVNAGYQLVVLSKNSNEVPVVTGL